MEEVLEFIHRRFKSNSDWLTGNCYYFASILKIRFPEDAIFYEAIDGHFVFKYNDSFYDWNGVYYPVEGSVLISWDGFEDFDPVWKQRLIRNCVM